MTAAAIDVMKGRLDMGRSSVRGARSASGDAPVSAGRAPIIHRLLVRGNLRCDDWVMVGRWLAVAGTLGLVVACLAQVRGRPDLAPGGGTASAIALQGLAAFALVVGAVRAAWPLACALLLAATGLALHALPEPHGGALL